MSANVAPEAHANVAANAHLPQISSCNTPYPHLIATNALGDAFAHVSAWFRQDAVWRRKVTWFYDQFNCVNIDDMLSPEQRPIVTARIKRLAEQAFGGELHDYCELTGHRMVEGQKIGIHNDDPADDEDYEDVRFLVFLNQSEGFPAPGLLILDKRTPDDETNARNIEFEPNLGMGMALHSHSFHAVLEIQGGYRDTLMFSFWSKQRTLPKRSAYAATKKSAPPATPNSPIFYQIVEELFPLLNDVAHSDGSLVAHLVGTYEILRAAGANEATCLAGLVHSINGTRRFALPHSDKREAILSSIRNSSGELGTNLASAVAAFEEISALRGVSSNAAVDWRGEQRLHQGLLVEIANDIEQLRRDPPSTAHSVELLACIDAVSRGPGQRFDTLWRADTRYLRNIDRAEARMLWRDMAIKQLPNNDLTVSVPKLGRAAEEISPDWYGASGLCAETPTTAIGRPLTKSAFEYFLLAHTQALPLWAAHGLLSKECSIVHCDSHSDLGKAPIRVVEGNILCSLTGASYGSLESVQFDRMVRRGSASIGNFLTLALLFGRCQELWQISHGRKKYDQRLLHIYIDSIVVGHRSFECVSAGCSPPPDAKILKSVNCHFAGADALDGAISGRRDIIFDLDADYFCNAFDDSAACFCGGDCRPDAVTQDIKLTLEAISARRENMLFSSCALSPGFFSPRYLSELGAANVQWA